MLGLSLFQRVQSKLQVSAVPAHSYADLRAFILGVAQSYPLSCGYIPEGSTPQSGIHGYQIECLSGAFRLSDGVPAY